MWIDCDVDSKQSIPFPATDHCKLNWNTTIITKYITLKNTVGNDSSLKLVKYIYIYIYKQNPFFYWWIYMLLILTCGWQARKHIKWYF